MNEPTLTRRLGLLQTLCGGLMVAMVGVNVIVATIVYLTLGGIPLAGQRFKVGGVSLATVVAGVISVIVPAACVWAAARKSRAAAGGSAEQLAEAFAGKVAVECLPVAGLAFVWAILFHLTADPLMPALVAGLIGYMIARFPTERRAAAWHARVTSRAPD